jgi:nuclease S1
MNTRGVLLAPVLLTLLTLFAASPALAWGCKGHQTVALLAEKHLAPEARQFMEKLLSENPIDPKVKRYCGGLTRDLLLDASTWPDDVRNDVKNGPWHYVDIPRGTPHGPIAPFCGNEGCVTKAIADQWAILKDKSADPRKRADALRYLIHFVGDLHMPLHASTNNDEGGNCVPVQYFRRRPRESRNSFTPNLHSLWDTSILERDMQGAEPAEYAEFLERIFSTELSKWQSAGIRVDDWAWESHDLADSYVYGELTPRVPVEAPVSVHNCSDANNIGERMMRLHLYAGENYQEISSRVIEERLAQAGIRLALILNDAASTKPASN